MPGEPDEEAFSWSAQHPSEERALPDSALVVRGGLPNNVAKGTGVTIDASGKLQGVSVNTGAGKTVGQLTQGLPQNKVCTTTVGEVRRAGGDVRSSPTPHNPNHGTMSGITPQKAGEILKVISNPAKNQQ
jgi:hypothetical protein